MKQLWIIVCLASLSCSKYGVGEKDVDAPGTKKDKDDKNEATVLSAPDYDKDGMKAWDGEAVQIATPNIASLQTMGKGLANILSKTGTISLDDGSVVQLTKINRRECPDGFDACKTTNSEELGVDSSAMVVSDSANLAARNQGERGTCVAFALNAALEILINREKDSAVDLSEQNTYFIGKHLTDSWNDAGLMPYDTIALMGEKKSGVVLEDAWPYNSEQAKCDTYNKQYPNATCSQTEAQGGGSDFKQQDENAKDATTAWTITAAHELYASLGRVKQALYQGYPVLLSINANIDFSKATKKQGVVSWVFKDSTCDGGICGHAVLAIGYKDDPSVEGGGYVIIKNSWGENFGSKGLVFATYAWFEASILDAQALVKIDR